MRSALLFCSAAVIAQLGLASLAAAQTPPALPPDVGTIPEKIRPPVAPGPASPGPTDPQLPPKGPDGVIRPPPSADTEMQKPVPPTGDEEFVVPPGAPLDDKPASPNK